MRDPAMAWVLGVIIGLLAALLALALGRLAGRGERRTRRVLDVFLRYPDTRLYGLDIGRLAGLSGGSLYPELLRLEQTGWLLSDWQEGPEPRRRVYWLNPERRPVSREHVEESRRRLAERYGNPEAES